MSRAASALEAKASARAFYRIHDRPSAEKNSTPRGEFVEKFSVCRLPKGTGDAAAPRSTRFLMKAKELPLQPSHKHGKFLRTQGASGFTRRKNIGHFGLALHKYAHFTSPIRALCGFAGAPLIDPRLRDSAPGGLDDGEAVKLGAVFAKNISACERGVDDGGKKMRLIASLPPYLSTKLGNEFDGVITGVTRFRDCFVETQGKMARDGIVPMRFPAPRIFYVHDEKAHALGRAALGPGISGWGAPVHGHPHGGPMALTGEHGFCKLIGHERGGGTSRGSSFKRSRTQEPGPPRPGKKANKKQEENTAKKGFKRGSEKHRR
jgi:ribonuclease R